IANYGIAILLLTLLTKIIFHPLTNKQMKAMNAQKKIQPELKKLQEKYKDQPKKLQEEMMKLWKTHKANPLSGCLPILIQLPFFIAIFYTMRSPSFLALLAEPGVNPGLLPFWASNLGLPDKTYILPIIVAATTYFSQKMMTTDPKQAKIFAFMPILMFFISMNMPSGVLLYWGASQAMSLVQQYYIINRLNKDENTITV
ncbi:YidC/Oxa1 family membrane protein insertase, partial [Candidatus Margulisiibacteriota bacterium]